MKPNYFGEPEHVHMYNELMGIVSLPSWMDKCYFVIHGNKKEAIDATFSSPKEEIICKELTDVLEYLHEVYHCTENEINLSNLYDCYTQKLYNFHIRTYQFRSK